MGFKKFILGAVIVAASSLALPTSPILAAEPPVFTGIVRGVAVGGYDPVAYFTVGKPQRGSKKFTTKYMGATWRFRTAANRDAFKANPKKYAPQYGGYCAWAVAQNDTAKGDPKHWKIVKGMLYLNYNANIQRRWEKNYATFIKTGDKNWPKVLNQ